MALINARNPLEFSRGDNNSDTFLDGTHWNLTTLKTWNYTYYSNGTLSNGSLCFLTFKPFTPFLLDNGTFLNSTSCYSPIEPMKGRSKIGLVFACLFAITLVFTFINIHKHGKSFLPTEKRFRAAGRKWQWYWMLVVGAFAIISSLADIDVDRYYLSELPIVLSSLFWYLMLLATMAVVWESVRHWGTWQERQVMDLNPVLMQRGAQRSKIELYLPLIFYFCLWMNFFMVVPRSWTNIEKQRSEAQTAMFAEPTATDIRFGLAPIFLLAGWFTIFYSLEHSIKLYKSQGQQNRVCGFIEYIPPRFRLTMPLSLIIVGYESACSFCFSVSPLNLRANLGMMYGLGWGAPLLIMLVQSISGCLDPNEDKELQLQRRLRSAQVNHAIGVTNKHHASSNSYSDVQEFSMMDV